MDGKLQVDAAILHFSKLLTKLLTRGYYTNWIIMGLEGSCIVG